MEKTINKLQCRYCDDSRHYTNIETLETTYFCCKKSPIEKVDPDDYCEDFKDRFQSTRPSVREIMEKFENIKYATQ